MNMQLVIQTCFLYVNKVDNECAFHFLATKFLQAATSLNTFLMWLLRVKQRRLSALLTEKKKSEKVFSIDRFSLCLVLRKQKKNAQHNE